MHPGSIHRHIEKYSIKQEQIHKIFIYVVVSAAKHSRLKMISGLSTPSYGEIEMFGYYTLFLNRTYASLCICVNIYGDSSYN